MSIDLSQEALTVKQWSKPRISGKVSQIVGLLIESIGPNVHIGELCYVYNRKGCKVPCEVVGFREGKILLMSLGEMSLIAPGSEVYPTGEVHVVKVASALKGRILDSHGEPIDNKGHIVGSGYYPISAPPPDVLKRKRITSVLETGIRAIDVCSTIGKGQRIGIFSGSGIGKSSLMGMLAKTSNADINVIALIGERGREVREFIEQDLGSEGLKRSVIIVATSDQPAMLRSRGSFVATAIAEYFRDLGLNVLLMMDSVTRFAMSLREIGLAVGEPPTTKGYTPSVFSTLPKLLERAGNSSKGSITGIYSVLVEGDDMNDPVADQVRSILDGHIVLSRDLAEKQHYPAIDILSSLSRVMPEIISTEHTEEVTKFKELIKSYNEAEDLINIGAYKKGSNSTIDRAVSLRSKMNEFLCQKTNERFDLSSSINIVKDLMKSETNT